MPSWTQKIKGCVTDKASKDALIGAVINVVRNEGGKNSNESVGGNWNTANVFQNFSYSKGSATDFLGFDNGLRSLHGGIDAPLAPELGANGKPVADYATSLLGNHMLPDRRRYLIDDALESGKLALSTGNDISREWTRLGEHIFSLALNDKHHFCFGSFDPDLQVGAYGERRSRDYKTRNFIYNWNVTDNNMPADFRHSDIPTLLTDEANMDYDKLYLLEEKQMRNNYRGNNTLGASYI